VISKEESQAAGLSERCRQTATVAAIFGGKMLSPTLGLLGLHMGEKVEYEASLQRRSGWGELRGSQKYRGFIKYAEHL